MTPLSIESLKAVSLNEHFDQPQSTFFWPVTVVSAAKTQDNSWPEAEFSQSK